VPVAANINFKGCDRDEHPPAYLLNVQDPAIINGGLNMNGQIVCCLPSRKNGFGGHQNKNSIVNRHGVTETHAVITVDKRPEFTITAWPQPPAPPAGHPSWSDGMAANPCWDHTQAADDPGFAILTFDPWYNNIPPPYNYGVAYEKGPNGS
jgi:hypothetical protein